MLRELQEEIARLRAKLDGKPMASGGGGAPGGPPAERRLVERMVDVEVEKIVEVEKEVEQEVPMSVASEYKQQLSVSGSPQRSNDALLLLIL